MTAFWTEADYDDHELVELVHDREFGPHRDHRAPFHASRPRRGRHAVLALCRCLRRDARRAAPQPRDELQERHGRPADGRRQGGDPGRQEPHQDSRDARRVRRCGRCAGRQLCDRRGRRHHRGRHGRDRRSAPASSRASRSREGEAGGDPGPFTAMGIYHGIKAAVAHKLGKDSLKGVHVALQGTGSVGGGVARLLAKDGARLTAGRRRRGARSHAGRAKLGGERGRARADHGDRVRRVQPQCARRDPRRGGHRPARLRDRGGRGEQPARPAPSTAQLLAARGILYAPDYVINAGGIISVTLEYLCRARRPAMRHQRGPQAPGADPRSPQHDLAGERPHGVSPDVVADRMAQKLIGR